VRNERFRKTIKPYMTTHAQREGAGESRKPWLQQFLLRGFMDAVGLELELASATGASFFSEDLANGFLTIGHVKSNTGVLRWS
jgi:hypothetical protein